MRMFCTVGAAVVATTIAAALGASDFVQGGVLVATTWGVGDWLKERLR